MDLKVTNNTKHFDHTPEITEKNLRGGKDEQRIAKAAKEFETMLTSMMLKSMKTKDEDDDSGESSFGGDYYDMIFQQEIASKFSEGKGLGIANEIFKKITGKSLPEYYPGIKLNNMEDIPLKNFDTEIKSFQPSTKSLERIGQYDQYIQDASDTYGVDKNIIKSVILTESAGNERAISKANAKGLMQLIDSTASDMGVNNVWDPRQNIFGGTKYLSQMLRQYNGDIKLALAGYNSGPGNVQKYKGIPPFEETQNYIARVMSYMNHLNRTENET